jgi:hypothetical protein
MDKEGAVLLALIEAARTEYDTFGYANDPNKFIQSQSSVKSPMPHLPHNLKGIFLFVKNKVANKAYFYFYKPKRIRVSDSFISS